MMNKHDLQEIEKLKEFRQWIKQFRNLTKEEQEKVKKDRWRGRPWNYFHQAMDGLDRAAAS